MRSLTTISLQICLLTLCIIIGSCKRIQVINVHKKQIKGCETGEGNCLPINVSRSKISDSILICFPAQGKETAIYLYDSAMCTAIKAGLNVISQTYPLAKRSQFRHDQPCLDLSHLKDGKYYAHILGDGYGGLYQINLTTNNQ